MNNNISEETKKEAWEDARFPWADELQKKLDQTPPRPV